MATTIVGLKIRETRRALGMSQSELARRMGISPAYLNLIEFSKRRIGGGLLKKAADCLDLQPTDLDGAAERRLAGELHEIAADPQLRDSAIDPETTEAFIGRFPDWANALTRLYRSSRASNDLATALSDRLTHDPYLGDIVHQMLTHISAIRSTSEILDDVKDIDAGQRDRFHRTLARESGRLTDVAQALADYFDKAHTARRSATPVEEIEAFLLAHDNYFEPLETAVEDLLRGTARDSFDPDGAGRAVLADAIEPLVDGLIERGGGSIGAVARRHVIALLTTYAADAARLPAMPFLESAVRCRYDLEALCQSWNVGFDRVCRRLTAVSGQLDEGPRLAYLAANAAGHTIDRRPSVDLRFPRHGAACPLWAIYRAQSTPEAVVRQLAQFPDGQRVLFVARARRTGTPGFNRPVDYVTDMLAVPVEAAGKVVYGDGLETGGRGSAEPVGPNCRICPRSECAHRAEDPLVGRLQS
ncbi:XRE family transcriptional regulator [Microbaculum marinum]|uniref:Short-chain fatty acyl-CoA regulator family protein n=1 Tax=Microbaculum marinum TaxID=1764581 RepID=A0AAW9RK35_9HYPH